MSISSLGPSTQPSFNFDGVASGLNTSDIITKLLSLDQGTLNSLQSRQAKVQARDTAYQLVKSKVATFQGAVQTLLLSSSVNAKTAASSTPGVATATANADAANGPFSLNVLHLATATSTTSSAAIGQAADTTPTTELSSAHLALPITSGTFTLNGQTITVTAGAGGDTWASLQSKISAATNGAVTLNLNANGVSLSSTSPIQIGAPTDSSNFLSATHLLNAPEVGSGPFTVANNQPLGAAVATAPLTSANLGVSGGIASGGSFLVNGVSISWSNTDSINAVLSRINASSAGVTASYDPTTDKVSLTNLKTGASSISLSDTSGNFLAAMGLAGAPQTAGSAAQYTITQNGVTSATQYSNSNTVTNALPGVNLSLLSEGTTSVTVAQDTSTTVKNVQAFVTSFNSLVDELENDTKYDPNNKTAGPLVGDPTILGIDDQVRGFVSGAAVVPTGSAYRTLADIGISTGAFGSAVGTTSHLTLDSSKLTTALQNNPQAVYNMLAGLSSTTSVTPDPTNPWIASVTGAPAGQVYSGTYKITYNPTGSAISSVFTQTGGFGRQTANGTIGPGGLNNTMLPGLSITALNPLPSASGTDTITYTVNTRGVMQSLNDYLNNLLGSSGVFATEQSDSQSELKDITDQIANQNELLSQKQQTLQAQFTAMEVALSQLQAQSGQMMSSLGVSSSSSSSSK